MIDRYTRPQMGAIWTLQNKFAAWLEVELAVCEAWYRLGRIPGDALEEIRAKAGFDVDRILEIEKETKHDVIAFLTAVEEKIGPASRFVHLGCTSSDILDTANALLLTRAGEMIAAGLDKLLEAIRALAREHKGRLCMGRTHGIHAEPISFGLKMASFYAEFSRHRERWAAAVDNIGFGKLSGAVGTYAHLSPEVELLTCEILGLKADPISTQIIQRDRHAQYFTSLALIAGGIERLAVELRHLQRTEVLEVEEGFTKGQKGSSAMPHKKNPISAENLTGLARLVRTNSVASMENMALWHERDISHSSVERVIMPDSTILVDYMLARMAGVLSRLKIKADNMAKNLRASFQLFYSQRVLMALIESGMERRKAYEAVQAIAMRCWEQGLQFPEEVRGDPELNGLLGAGALDEVFDPSYYLRFEDEIFGRVFGAPQGES
jgi:adenylosuccinate lyase